MVVNVLINILGIGVLGSINTESIYEEILGVFDWSGNISGKHRQSHHLRCGSLNVLPRFNNANLNYDRVFKAVSGSPLIESSSLY